MSALTFEIFPARDYMLSTLSSLHNFLNSGKVYCYAAQFPAKARANVTGSSNETYMSVMNFSSASSAITPVPSFGVEY